MNGFNNIHPLLFHVVILLLCFFTQFPVLSRCCHDYERNALLNFKSFLGDPSNRLSSWKAGNESNCCDWYGIRCSDDSFHIVALDLRNTNGETNRRKDLERIYDFPFKHRFEIPKLLEDHFDPYSSPTTLNGTISPSLFNLTHLQYLDLSFNDFRYSQIPHKFENLKKLSHLDLSFSKFSGSIMTQFANLSSLSYLDVSSDSELKTSMTWLRGLVNLKVLRLNGVDLSDVSSTDKNWAEPFLFLSNLRELDLSYCIINGINPINDQFLNLSRLSSLKMKSTGLKLKNSTIPIQLANLTSLSVLDLTNCNLHGSIPYIPQLKELHVQSNRNLIVDLITMFEWKWPKLHTLSMTGTHVIQSIPSSISNTSLPLVKLFASYCSILGSFPSSILKLPQLQVLDLSFNNITGHLPSSISQLPQLEYLDLSVNQITGHLPSSISNLSQLEYLDLSENEITGQLPSSVSNLSQLKYMELSFNKITGHLPSFSNLKELKFLYLSENKFQGSIPESICEISSLQRLVFKGNNFTGRIPSCINNLQKLNYFDVGRNSIGGNHKGDIHVSICNLTNLIRLDLSQNSLMGAIPFCLFKLTNLTYLYLSRNNLQGPLPLPPQGIEIYDLSQNDLNGGISMEAGKRLSNAVNVHLFGNKLSGSIPFSLCSSKESDVGLLGLKSLDLSNNQLSGTIPSSLGNCTSLLSLHLGMNNLTGNVPKELKQATTLAFLQLNDNTLNGIFPNFIYQLQVLRVLNLGNNNFRGSIPTSIGSLFFLQILSLRSNKFNGTIPKEISNLKELQILDLSRNNFSGPIPKIGNLIMLNSRPNSTFNLGEFNNSYKLDASVQLQMVIKGIMMHFERIYNYHSGIDLSYNILDGNIPEEIGLLKGLGMLSLSHNRLSGKIPTSVGNMNGLESLDLSFNKFSGDIPQSLTSIDSLGYLNLSYNNLSGRIPRGSHFETLSVDGLAYVGNPLLCGVPTEKRCKGDPVPTGSTDVPTSIQNDEDDGEDAKEKLLYYGTVFSGFGVGFWGLFMVLLLKKEKWWFGYWRIVDKIAAKIFGWVA